MYVESLRLTPQGLQAFTSAKDGGVFLRPTRCSFGTYFGTEPAQVPEELVGEEVCAVDGIRYLEVLGGNLVRFTFDIPANVPSSGSVLIGEALISLEDGIPFAHVVLKDPIHKYKGNNHRISLLLYMIGEADVGRVFNVTMGEHVTLPQVSSVNWLPPVSSAMSASAVVVADLFTVSDGDRVPGLAFRSGIGGEAWTLAGHDRIWADSIGPRFISPTQLNGEGMSDLLEAGMDCVVSVISGGGAGYCRTAEFDGQLIQLATDIPEIPLFSASSVVAIWIPSSGVIGTGGEVIKLPPNTGDVPPDWVLTPGEDGGPPKWSPPGSANAGAQGVVLYTPPSRLTSKSLVTTATPSTLAYELPEGVETASDVMLVVGGATQPKSAFTIVDSDQLTLSEGVPTLVDLNARAFVREPTTGHEIDIQVVSFTCDGSNPEIELGAGITDVEQVIPIVNRIQNPVTAFTISDGKLRFTENPPAGAQADLYCIRHRGRVGASTKIVPHQFFLDVETSHFQLSFAPVSKSHVFVIDSGTVVMQNEFQLLGDQIILTTPIQPSRDRFVEILVFVNHVNSGSPDRSLEGVFTHAYMGPSGLVIERHGRTPLIVPVPRAVFSATDGIVVDDSQYPYVKMRYDPSSDPAAKKRTSVYARQHTTTNTEEITLVESIEIADDVSIVINAEFSASLGPGFSSELNRESIECVVSVVEVGTEAPKFGSNARGTGRAGFSAYSEADSQSVVYADRHLNYSADLVASNYAARVVEVVAKMRVVGAKVSAYGSDLNIQLNILTTR